MSTKEILEIAIQKAIDGGWWNQVKTVKWHDKEDPQELVDLYFKDGSVAEGMNIQAIIFNHDFSKALWGETKVNDMVDKYELLKKKGLVYAYDSANESFEYDEPVWMWHLQQMVIAEDPIKYLGENS